MSSWSCPPPPPRIPQLLCQVTRRSPGSPHSPWHSDSCKENLQISPSDPRAGQKLAHCSKNNPTPEFRQPWKTPSVWEENLPSARWGESPKEQYQKPTDAQVDLSPSREDGRGEDGAKKIPLRVCGAQPQGQRSPDETSQHGREPQKPFLQNRLHLVKPF